MRINQKPYGFRYYVLPYKWLGLPHKKYKILRMQIALQTSTYNVNAIFIGFTLTKQPNFPAAGTFCLSTNCNQTNLHSQFLTLLFYTNLMIKYCEMHHYPTNTLQVYHQSMSLNKLYYYCGLLARSILKGTANDQSIPISVIV